MIAEAAVVLSLLCPSPHGSSASYEVSADGRYVVCLTDHDTPSKYELYSVGVPGGGVMKLSMEVASNRDVIRYSISPDSHRVAFTIDPAQWTKYDLYTVPIAGGDARKVNAPLPVEHDVDTFSWVGDSTRVVYRQGRNTTGDWKLYSAPPTGGATQISQHGYTVSQAFGIAWDGQHIRYQAEPLGSGGSQTKWYVVPASGGRIAEEIFMDGFESGGVTRW